MKIAKKFSTIAIIPAYNESTSIADVVCGLRSQDIDVLVIDDASDDLTGFEARQAGATVITLKENRGVAGAIKVGMRYSSEHRYDFTVQCDGDGQHPPLQAQRLVEISAAKKLDLLIGNRFDADDNQHFPNLVRRSVIQLLRFVVRIKTGRSVRDVTSGYRVFSKQLVLQLSQEFPTYYLGDTFEVLVATCRAGYRVEEVPVPMNIRQSGKSSNTGFNAFTATARAVFRVLFGKTILLKQFSREDPIGSIALKDDFA